MVLTPSLCRGARALLKWPRARLALEAKLSKTTIFNYELLRRTMSLTSKAAITHAFRGAGVDLPPSGKGSDTFELMVVNRQEDSLTGLPATDTPWYRIRQGCALPGALCRAGRALLCWTPEVLAAQAALPWQIVSDFEAGNAIGSDAEDEIFNAFSAVGVFVLASAGEGYGLRLAKSAETLQDLVQLAQGRDAQSFKLARGKARLIEYCACWDQDAAHTDSAMDELDVRIAGEIARRSRVRGWDGVCFLLAAWRSWIAEKDACGYEVV